MDRSEFKYFLTVPLLQAFDTKKRNNSISPPRDKQFPRLGGREIGGGGGDKRSLFRRYTYEASHFFLINHDLF